MFDYISSNVTFNATMVQTSSSIVVTLGTQVSGGRHHRTAAWSDDVDAGVRRHRPGRNSCSTTVAIEDYPGRLRVLVSGAVQRADDKVQARHHLFGIGPRVGKHRDAEVPRPIPDREGRPPQPHAR